MNSNEIFQSGVGRSITFFGRTADMLSLSLSATEQSPYEFAVHIMTMSEVYYQNQLLTSTNDMYDDNGIYGAATYDKKISEIWTGKEKYTLQKLFYDDFYCLHAIFDHGLEICSCPNEENLSDADELWRVFLAWSVESQVVAYPNRIEEEKIACTQEELNCIRNELVKRRRKHKKSVID